MRFLAAVLLLTAAAAQTPPEYQMRERTSTGGETLKHVVYVPRNLAPDRRYPLTVYLHGSCDVCVTHERILQESGLRFWHAYDRNEQREPTFLVAPAGGTRGWSSQPRRDAVFEIVDGLLAEFPIDRRRIYIMGFSMGGAGIWDYLQKRPNFFAAANPQAIGGGTVDAAVVRNTPIWTTIGVDDVPNRLEQLTANVARIRAANGDPRGAVVGETGVNPRFSVFPSTNHGQAQGRTQELPGLAEWFYSQVNDGNAAPNVRFVRPLALPDPYAPRIAALASAADPDGAIERVEFLLDQNPASTDREAPYEHVFENLSPGVHVLGARAFDDRGKWRATEVTIRVR